MFVHYIGQFPPDIDTFPPNDITLFKGKDHTLTCKDSNELDAETIWFRGAGIAAERIDFSKEDKTKIITNKNQDLIFLNPQPEPAGRNPSGFYTCHVKNDIGTKELGYDLKVSLACKFFLIILNILI